MTRVFQKMRNWLIRVGPLIEAIIVAIAYGYMALVFGCVLSLFASPSWPVLDCMSAALQVIGLVLVLRGINDTLQDMGLPALRTRLLGFLRQPDNEPTIVTDRGFVGDGCQLKSIFHPNIGASVQDRVTALELKVIALLQRADAQDNSTQEFRSQYRKDLRQLRREQIDGDIAVTAGFVSSYEDGLRNQLMGVAMLFFVAMIDLFK